MAGAGAPTPKALLTADGDVKVKELRLHASTRPSTRSPSRRPGIGRTTKGAKKAGRPRVPGRERADAADGDLPRRVRDRRRRRGHRHAASTGSKPTPSSVKKKKPQPPILTFTWGTNEALDGFQAYLKSVSAKYTMFKPDGTPTRATANITLEEAPADPKKQNPTSGAIHGRAVHVVRDGDSLTSIAYDEYGDADDLARPRGVQRHRRSAARQPRRADPDPDPRRSPAAGLRATRWPKPPSRSRLDRDRRHAAGRRPDPAARARDRWTTTSTCPTCSSWPSATSSATCWRRRSIKIGSRVRRSRRPRSAASKPEPPDRGRGHVRSRPSTARPATGPSCAATTSSHRLHRGRAHRDVSQRQGLRHRAARSRGGAGSRSA